MIVSIYVGISRVANGCSETSAAVYTVNTCTHSAIEAIWTSSGAPVRSPGIAKIEPTLRQRRPTHCHDCWSLEGDQPDRHTPICGFFCNVFGMVGIPWPTKTLSLAAGSDCEGPVKACQIHAATGLSVDVASMDPTLPVVEVVVVDATDEKTGRGGRFEGSTSFVRSHQNICSDATGV